MALFDLASGFQLYKEEGEEKEKKEKRGRRRRTTTLEIKKNKNKKKEHYTKVYLNDNVTECEIRFYCCLCFLLEYSCSLCNQTENAPITNTKRA